jgi:hypothetical protein
MMRVIFGGRLLPKHRLSSGIRQSGKDEGDKGDKQRDNACEVNTVMMI